MNKLPLTWYRRWLKSKQHRQPGYLLQGKIEPHLFQTVIQQNRRSLGQISQWFRPDLIKNSVFRYGVNPEVEPLLNLPVDNECTHADLLVYFCGTMTAPCKYLELGVSVGKTLWQVLNGCSPCECWAFDIEEMNPVLQEHLSLVSRHEWPSPAGSLKKTPASLSRYTHLASGNQLVYICADIFDPQAWQCLARQNFQVVLSDALHTPEALEFEWSQMTAQSILHPQNAIIMWDDLDGPMRDWFLSRRSVLARDLAIPESQIGTVFANGWLGRREFPHRLGLAFKTVPLS